MITGWFYAALGLAGLQWIARWRELRWLHYVTKPGVGLALILWFWQAGGWEAPALLWFGVALVFALVGDVALMLPPRFFLAGLGAFLLGHLFYIAGFNSGPLRGGLVFWAAGLPAAAAAAWGVSCSARSFSAGVCSGRTRACVTAYALVIVVMLLSAVTTFLRPAWQPGNAALVSAGALLFSVSDGMLGYNRFVRRIGHAHVWIMITYHLAQVFILLGALRQFA